MKPPFESFKSEMTPEHYKEIMRKIEECEEMKASMKIKCPNCGSYLFLNTEELSTCMVCHHMYQRDDDGHLIFIGIW